MTNEGATVRGLSEYARFLEKECPGDGLLFRGQPVDKPLLPRIARLSLGAKLKEAERYLLDEFKRQAPPLLTLQPVPTDDWDWLALAQHYGMPTRLLDWTANPMAALWFAVAQPPVDSGPGVIWVFDTHEDEYVQLDGASDPFRGKWTAVFRPRHITRRIVAQAGWFTVHRYVGGRKGFAALEVITRYSERLRKLFIPADSFPAIRRELDRWGFNAATLFADLHGLCKHLEWQKTGQEKRK